MGASSRVDEYIHGCFDVFNKLGLLTIFVVIQQDIQNQ